MAADQSQISPDPMPRWRQIERMFLDAVKLDGPARDEFLTHSCGGDDQLLSAVRLILGTGGDATQASVPSPLRPSATAADSIEPGTRVGPYECVERLGEGGMGTVMLARQERPVQRVVALKVIKSGVDNRSALARFHAERQALALMNHPNVAAVYEAGETDSGRPYFVMEYVPGQPITRYCDERRLALPARLELFVYVCQAVHHAHQKGVIHRDIKPSNVLVTEVGGKPAPKVIDFGLARALQQDGPDRTLVTQYGEIVGTPAYMSPEQADYRTADIDTRTDVYSLGVLLYELLTGRLPFESKPSQPHLQDLLRAIRETDPPRPSARFSSADAAPEASAVRGLRPEALRRALRGDLDWIVLKAIEKSPQRRYASAAELGGDVERFLRGDVVSAREPTLRYRVGKLVRRHRIEFIATASVVAALVFGLVGMTFQYRRVLAAEQRQTQLTRRAESARAAESAQRAYAESSRRRAELEAAKSAAVSRFLGDLLSSADPDVNQGRQLTVREAVDDAAHRLEAGALSGQPEVESAVHSTLGQVYESLGDMQSAERQTRRALELAQLAPDWDIESDAGLRTKLSALLTVLDRTDEALTLAEESLALREWAFGEDSLNVSASLDALAGARREREDLTESAWLREDSLRIQRAHRGPDDPELATALSSCGVLLAQLGRYREAEAAYDEAICILRGDPTRRQLDLARTLSNFAALCVDMGLLDRAEPLLEETLSLYKRLLREDHPHLAITLNNLSSLAYDRGNWAQAESYARESLRMRRSRLAGDDSDIAFGMGNLAAIVLIQGRQQEAEALLREALDIARKCESPNRLVIAKLLYDLGDAASARNDHAEAIERLRESVRLWRETLPAGHFQISIGLGYLGFELMQLGRFDEAEAAFRETVDIRREQLPDHWSRWFAEARLGACLSRQGRFAEADEWITRGVAGMEASSDTPRAQLRSALEDIARHNREWHAAEASAEREEAIRRWETRLRDFDAAASQPGE